MGLFWDLYQQSQISQQGERAATLESRVGHLEQEVDRLARLLHEVIARLEKHVGVDLDQDGRVG
jgi:Tfp pilus assembly protein PilN